MNWYKIKCLKKIIHNIFITETEIRDNKNYKKQFTKKKWKY